MMPVVHNLEAQDSDFINYILKNIEVGSGTSGFLYNVTHDGKASVYGYRGSFAVMSQFEIPSEIDGYPVAEIGSHAFDGCFRQGNVTKIIIPSSVKKIGDYAFYNCGSIQSVEFASHTLEEIGEAAFAYCTELSAFGVPTESMGIINPTSIRRIGQNAFERTAISSFAVNENLTYIGANAFLECSRLTGFTFTGVNDNYTVQNGVLYNKNLSELICYPAGKVGKSFTVPETVHSIWPYAIYGNSNLERINLNQVKGIGAYGLAYNSSLAAVTGGEELAAAERNSFEGTKWFDNQSGEFVAIGNLLLAYNGTSANLDLSEYKYIASLAFLSNSTLESVTFGNDTVTIGNFAFLQCKNLSRANLYNVNQMIFVGSHTFGEEVEIFIPNRFNEEYRKNDIWTNYADQLNIKGTTVHFVSDGQDVPDRTLLYYEQIGDLPVQNKTGFDFAGWKYSDGGQEVVARPFDLWTLTDDEIVFTADWTASENQIRYNLNGGEYNGQTEFYLENFTTGEVSDWIVPARRGYTFGGWFFDAALTKNAGAALTGDELGDVELYAKWTPNSYKVSLYTDADNTESPWAEYTVTFNSDNYDFGKPSIDGFVFNCWKTAEGNSLTDNLGKANQKWDIADDVDLFASWTREKYYIKINADGMIYWLGANNEFSEEKGEGIEYGTQFSNAEALQYAFRNAKRVIKEGYKFEYFTLEPPVYAAWGEEQIAPEVFEFWGGTMTDCGENESVFEIYAYFVREKNFYISFIGEDTDNEGVNPFKADFGAPISLMAASPKKGHTFKYWTVSARQSGNESVLQKFAAGSKFAFTTMPDLSVGEEDGLNIYLEAYYEPNTYTISFYTDYGTTPSNTSIVYDTKKQLPIPSDVPGRSFVYWYAEQDGQRIEITDETGAMKKNWEIDKEAELYAHWDVIPYTITFIPNGGNAVDPIHYNVDSSTFSLGETSRDGYRFSGWFEKPDFSGSRTVCIYQGDTGSKTFYARWEKLYTLTFKIDRYTEGTLTGVYGETKILPSLGRTQLGYTLYWDGIYEVGYVYTVVADKTFNAVWKANTYTITLDDNYSGSSTTIQVQYGQAVTYESTAPGRWGYKFVGYYPNSDGTGKQYFSAAWVNDVYGWSYTLKSNNVLWNLARNGTLYAKWELLTLDYAVQCWNDGEVIDTMPVTLTHGQTVTLTAKSIKNYKFTDWNVNGQIITDESFQYEVTLIHSYIVQGPMIASYPYNSPGFISAYYEKDSCIAEGTLITLADGRQVPVESLTGNESLLVWNLYTGTFDSAPILFIDKDASATYRIINLAFSDGTELKVISEHGLWDYNLNRYVYLDEDAAQYIGHWFNKQTTDGGVMTSSRVQLTGVTVSMEETVAYSPVTYGHLCYYVNGLLSMPGGIDGLFNIFEVDAETMRYDAAAMERDIAQYGLFTYEEFAQMLNVPQEVYDAFNAQYFKVAIGKGIVTEERLAELAERYARQLGIV